MGRRKYTREIAAGFLPRANGGSVAPNPVAAGGRNVGGATGGLREPSGGNTTSSIGPANNNQNASAKGGNITIVPGLGTAVVFIVGGALLLFVGLRVLNS